MSPLKILIGPNPILEKVCQSNFTIPEKLIPEMFRLLKQHQAYGLAAPQVGIDARFFVTCWGEIFINPIITWHSCDRKQVREGCLSFPNKSVSKIRHNRIVVGGHQYSGLKAWIIQHELDHLNGITIITGE